MFFDSDEDFDDDDDFDFKKDGIAASAFNIPDPSFVIIAIDTHPNMFVKTEPDDGPGKAHSRFEICLDTCYELAMNLLLAKARSWNQFAIVLTVEDQKQATLVPFHNNMIDTIKLLEEKKNLPFKQLQDEYQNSHANLGEFLSICVRNFNDIRGNFTKRTLIYITDDDNPTKGDKDQRFIALNSAKLLKEHKIDVELVTFNADFSYKFLYNEFFSVLDQTPEEKIIEDKEGLLYTISTPITNRVISSKTYFFPIAGNAEKYLILLEESLVAEFTLNCNSYRSYTGEEIERGYKNFDEDGNDISSGDYVVEGINNVTLTMEELKSCIETHYSVGYTLVGIFDRPPFDSILHLSIPTLLKIHPKEDLPHFNKMWSYGLLKNKRFICVQKKRSNDSLRFVELVPKLIKNEKYFMVRKIPFCDEIEDFSNPEMEQEATRPEVVDKLNKIMDALTIDYEPGMFADPALAKKLSYLKSQLLGIPKEEIVDKTLNNEAIDKRLADLVSELEETEWDEWAEEAGAAKRKAPQKATSSKKSKK